MQEQNPPPSTKFLKISSMPPQMIHELKKKSLLFPQNCVCYIKIKICDGDIKLVTVKGSGVMIAKDIVLTAAHNVYDHREKIQQFINIKKKVNDKSYVKLALCEGKSNGIYDIENIRISQKYIDFRTNQNMLNNQRKQQCYYDYALLRIRKKKDSVVQQIQQFPIPLAIDDTNTLKQSLTICGYAIFANMMNHINQQDHSNSSILMQDAFQAQGEIIKNPQNIPSNISKQFIQYDVATDEGTSGSAIFTKYKKRDVIIGIHKAARNDKNSHATAANVGIKLTTAIEEVNQWGYQYHKKPFIFTDKTLDLYNNPTKIDLASVLFYMDKKIQMIDLHVITSYDLSHLRKIMLNGNLIKDQGFKLLTKRQFNQLDTLFVSQNHLRNLHKIPQENWRNINTVTTLALSINKLTVFPENLKYMKNLEILWLSYNRIDKLTDKFINFCQQRKNQLLIHMYENKLNNAQPTIINTQQIISKTKVVCLWKKVKQQQLF